MKKAKKSIGIVLVALLLVLCLAVDALAVRYGTVITRFWSGTYGTVQTETDDTSSRRRTPPPSSPRPSRRKASF